MKDEFEPEGRSIPGPVMDYLRKIAVRAVEEKGYSPEAVIDMLGLSPIPVNEIFGEILSL